MLANEYFPNNVTVKKQEGFFFPSFAFPHSVPPDSNGDKETDPHLNISPPQKKALL